MNVIIVLSSFSSLFFTLSAMVLVFNRRRLQLPINEYVPLLISACLYSFITFSNILEHTGVTTCLDPFEDVSEIVFLLMTLFFINNWRARQNLASLQEKKEHLSTALQKIHEKEREYRLLVENANDAIFVAQGEKLVFFNTRTAEMLGFTEKEIFSQPFVNFIHPQDREFVLANFRKRVMGEVVPSTYAFRAVTREKVELIVQLSTVAIEWEHAPATLCFARDITEMKKLEQQLIYSQKMESIGTLAGGVAHDFNNILSAIIGYTELAKAKLKEGPVVKDLEKVLVAGDRAKQLIKQILNISRKSQYDMVPVEVHSVVQEVLKLIRSSIPATITIEQDIDQKSGAILADPTQVHQVVMNLCTNAYHAMRKNGGVLTVSLRQIQVSPDDSMARINQLKPGRYIELLVSDTGHGIEKECLSKIFDPYFTTKDKNEGTGLGLAVVHGIVKHFGGHISVSSELDKGTRFSIFLPRVDVPGQSDAKLSLPDYPAGDERVLVVDDEEVLPDMIKEMLESLGYSVTAITDSVSALQAFKHAPRDYDLLITDMTMPKMDGLELIREITKIRPEVPVILCTGNSESLDGKKSETLGVKKFLMKPVLKQDLAVAVREVLDK